MTPTVLIPGLACTAETFAPQTTALWPYGPITVASTLEGRTIAEMAAAILRDAPPRFALGGISMGGYISLEIMRQSPERVIKLALLDTSARADTPEQIEARRLLNERVANGELEAVLAQVTPNLLHPLHRQRQELIDVQVRMGRDVGPAGFIRQEAAITKRIDSRPHLADIKVPTLILVGDKDVLTPPDRSEEMAAAISNSRLVVVPQCGHASTLEQPEAVNAALTEWLSA
ncbi:alpha/beta fold hydrolase [Brevundimonas sp.]|jgi:pimeloyl-ACP methyl ester carboxylesterase|uniref:alpha/beta fold hydrolase n=1 Tax=Brevundimonas sp. TaxID=1871086 RepID=UPI0037C15298